MNLSVLVPTYKRPVFLKRNLESIITSKVNRYEVIIGDDGGDKETVEVCNSFINQLPIKYLPPSGKGSLASNITRLLKAASGDWILFIHDDDFLIGDHSKYPEIFSDKYDFCFSDHWISNEEGIIDEKKSLENSVHYKRDVLVEGMQSSGYSLAMNESVCLDGFYAKTSTLNKYYPNKDFGQVADYFWVFQVITSGVKIGYLKHKFFSYTLSSNGLTSLGGHLNEDLIAGFKHLLKNTEDSEYKKQYKEKISFNTWYAVNSCIRRGEKKKAWQLLKDIHFKYSHSFAKQLQLPLQLLWLAIK